MTEKYILQDTNKNFYSVTFEELLNSLMDSKICVYFLPFTKNVRKVLLYTDFSHRITLDYGWTTTIVATELDFQHALVSAVEEFLEDKKVSLERRYDNINGISGITKEEVVLYYYEMKKSLLNNLQNYKTI